MKDAERVRALPNDLMEIRRHIDDTSRYSGASQELLAAWARRADEAIKELSWLLFVEEE